MPYPLRPPQRPKPPPANPLPPPALREQLAEFAEKECPTFGGACGEWVTGTPEPTIYTPAIIIPPPPWSPNYRPELDPDYQAPPPEIDSGVIEETPREFPPPERGVA